MLEKKREVDLRYFDFLRPYYLYDSELLLRRCHLHYHVRHTRKWRDRQMPDNHSRRIGKEMLGIRIWQGLPLFGKRQEAHHLNDQQDYSRRQQYTLQVVSRH